MCSLCPWRSKPWWGLQADDQSSVCLVHPCPCSSRGKGSQRRLTQVPPQGLLYLCRLKDWGVDCLPVLVIWTWTWRRWALSSYTPLPSRGWWCLQVWRCWAGHQVGASPGGQVAGVYALLGGWRHCYNWVLCGQSALVFPHVCLEKEQRKVNIYTLWNTFKFSQDTLFWLQMVTAGNASWRNQCKKDFISLNLYSFVKKSFKGLFTYIAIPHEG